MSSRRISVFDADETGDSRACLQRLAMELPCAVYRPTTQRGRARYLRPSLAWLRANVWALAALVWATFVLRECWGCLRPPDVIRCGSWLAGYQTNYALSVSFDQRCELADDGPEAEALEERIRSEFAATCGNRIYPGFITPQCVRGNAHWVFCDGRVRSVPPEDAELSPLVAIAVSERARSVVADRDTRVDKGSASWEHLRGEPTLGQIYDSMLYAAAAYRRRGRGSAGVAIDESELQDWLDRQCSEQGDERVLVRDLDRYRGQDPDAIYCDRIDTIGGGTFVLDRTTETWTKLP